MSIRIRALLLQFMTGTTVRARLARATGWMLGGSVLQQGFAMLAGIACARILGPSRFGELGIVRSTTVVFATLAGSGLSIATTRYVAALRIEDRERAGRVIGLLVRLSLALSTTAAVLLATISHPLAQYVAGAPQLALPMAISGIGIIALIAAGVQQGVITGCESFRAAAWWVALEGMTASTLMVAGAWTNGVTGATAGFVIGLSLMAVLKHGGMLRECARAGIPLAGNGWRREFSILGEFVLPAILVSISAQPAEWLGRMLLARSPGGLVQVGLFTAAFGWAQLVLFLPLQIGQPTMPMLSSFFAGGDFVAFKKLIIESSTVIMATGVGVALPLCVLSPWIMRAYGKSFAGGAATLTMLAAAYAVGSVSIVFRATLLSVGKAWLQNAHMIVWGVTMLAVLFLMRSHGAFALATSYLFAFIVLAILQFVTIVRYMRSHQ